MFPDKLAGSPASMRELANWLRTDLVRQLTECESAVVNVRQGSLDHWWDTAGQAFALNLGSGGHKIEWFAQLVAELAGMLEESAWALERAQELMDAAVQIADEASLVRKDGWIQEPTRNDVIALGMPAFDSKSVEDLYASRLEAYGKALALVDEAATLVLDRLGQLASVYKFNWSGLIFSGGDLAAGETAALAGWFQSRYLEESSRRIGWGREFLELSRQHGAASPLGRYFEQHGAAQGMGALRASYAAANAGWIAKVAGKAGPVLALSGVVYDIWVNHSPPQKAIFTGGIAFGAGLLVAAAVPGPGWAVLAAGAAGLIAGEIAGLLYDKSTQKTASQILFESDK